MPEMPDMHDVLLCFVWFCFSRRSDGFIVTSMKCSFFYSRSSHKKRQSVAFTPPKFVLTAPTEYTRIYTALALADTCFWLRFCKNINPYRRYVWLINVEFDSD